MSESRDKRGFRFMWLGVSRDAGESQWASDSMQMAYPEPPVNKQGLNRRSKVFTRLWLGFMMARVMAGVVLVLIPVFFALFGGEQRPGQILISLLYLAVAVWQRWIVGSQYRLQVTSLQLWSCMVLDVVTVALLNDPASRFVNYNPLLALPLLYASVLGTRVHALGMAAALASLLLFDVWHVLAPGGAASELSPLYLQAGLKGVGAFLAAALINQLAVRLDSEIRHTQHTQEAVRAQIKVNELVLSEMPQGVLVVDRQALVRSANPAALAMLGLDSGDSRLPLNLDALPQWAALAEFVITCFDSGVATQSTVELPWSSGNPRSVQLNGRLVMPESAKGPQFQLCVVFMQDMRRIQASIREERMAAMGRMSAAVAHEIRNPLSAIVQANALLMEEGQTPRQQRMASIVAQNAQRIAQTVEDVLDVSRFPRQGDRMQSAVWLQTEVLQVCQEWSAMHGVPLDVQVQAVDPPWRVRFDSEHLRRVMVNLLDNARRHCDRDNPVITVWTGLKDAGLMHLPCLIVANTGEPIDRSIAEHLFEPFFSSQARSSGLGLYICRQLCEAHDAKIRHERGPMPGGTGRRVPVPGNLFSILFQRSRSVQEIDQTSSRS